MKQALAACALSVLLAIYLGAGKRVVEEPTHAAPAKKNAAPQPTALELPPKAQMNPPIIPATPQVPDIAQVQRSLQEALKIHQELEQRYGEQLKKMQRIAEQARYHQKIVQTLQAQQAPAVAQTEQVIQQEKLRLIAEQTKRHQQFLEQVKSSPPSSHGSLKTPQQSND